TWSTARPMQHGVNQFDRARCQACASQGCIERCEIRRADFLEQFVAQMPTYMVQSKSVTLTRGCIYVGGCRNEAPGADQMRRADRRATQSLPSRRRPRIGKCQCFSQI